LMQERLQILQQLVQEQLQAGHIVPSTSPWNTPIFTIPKKSGKWRLLHDLRAVNAVMQDMGALQPGLPSPGMIPQNWTILIIDLKDCFFTISLHPEDMEKFAFTVPAINKGKPAKRYHWTVLSQGMKNSPTICQTFVAWALTDFCQQHPEWQVYHYTDDILVAGKDLSPLVALRKLKNAVEPKGLVVAPEKAQTQTPWKYLRCIVTGKVLRPQKVEITTKIDTLADVQKLLGDLQWVRSIVGITNDDLAPLMPLLGHSTD
ncbi:hypothetical protein N320_01224, partial [Buceros rhinoceros silvestris]